MRALIYVEYISIFLIAIESGYIFFNWKTKQHSYLFCYCLAILVNNIGYLIEMTAKSSLEAFHGTQVAYVGKIWIPISFFVFVVSFCEINIPKKIYIVLAAIHLCILGLVMSTQHHGLYYKGITYVETGLFPHNVYGHGIVYNCYMCMIALYSIIGLSIIVFAIRRETNRKTKVLLYYLFISAFIQAASFVIFLTGITKGYDTTVIGYTLSTIFMYIALFRHKLLETLELVKDYVVDNLSEGIIAIDDEGKIIYYNEPALAIYPDMNNGGNGILAELDYYIEKNELLYKQDRIYRPEIKPFLEKGRLLGSLYILKDETKQQKYTMELKEQKELAEAANESKSAFLSIVSHEIRTPMNAVVGMTDLLLQEELTDKQRKYMTNIKNSGAALVMLINDILDQSKIEAGKMELIEEAYELRAVVEDVEMIIENRIGGKPIHLIIHIDEKIPKFLVGDALRMRQIFINLMNNAVKFTDRGYIQFSAEVVEESEEKYKIRFGVKDSGQGIRKEDLDKLGKAFAQVDTKRNHSKEGTGLGLSISSDFIGMMGGQLLIESTYGKGSEFYFIIEQGKADENAQNSVQKWNKEEFTAQNAKVLVVDDTEINLTLTQEVLKTLKMQVDTASSGKQAYKMVQEKQYDIIFMDYIMPGMDGVETTDKVRKLAEKEKDEDRADYYKAVPIIALTGDTSDRTQELFHVAGINDMVEKPVDIHRLRALIKKWIPEELID